MLNYKAIEIFTSEKARYRRKPIADAVIKYVHDLKIAARCIVTRGISGCYESGELATGRLEVLSLSMPIRIYIILPATETDRVLDGLNGMINDGIVVLHDLNVLSFKTRNTFFPRQLLVRDVMTRKPESVKVTTPLNDVLKLLLPSVFSGLPVLDEQQRPVGVVTQGDLIRKGGLPLRLGLLAEADQSRRDAVLNQLESRQAGEVMTTPAVIIADNRPLADAVDMMLSKGVKRLVVVDEKKRLSGMLSRLDIFRTVMREAPEWKTFSAQEIEVGNLKLVGEVLRRDTHKVSPHASLDEVIRLIDSSDIQRVAVVDPEGKLLGLIADRDLLRYFKSGQEGIWHHLAKVKHPFEKDNYQGNLQQSLKETTAGMVMKTELVTVHDDMMIEEAISLMVDRGLKRLPVIDADGRFRGMISRDELLRTGLGLIDK